MVFNFNQPLADTSTTALASASLLLFYKQSLVSVGWTAKSGMGTAYTASGDPWVTLANVAAATNNAHCVLESPAGFITGGSGKVWIMLCGGTSTGGGITAHNVLPSGGSATVRPVSTEQLNVLTEASQLLPTAHIGLKVSFTGWTNGAFQFVTATIGSGTVSNYFSCLTPADNTASYPYCVAFKFLCISPARMSVTNFEQHKIWNRSGQAANADGRIMFNGNSLGAIGANVGFTGDYQGNHHQSGVVLYNCYANNWERLGTLGAEGYYFAVTGSAALGMGTMMDIGNTQCNIGSVFVPANTTIYF
jgi:hypothetical protein